jgi:tellurite resistance protein
VRTMVEVAFLAAAADGEIAEGEVAAILGLIKAQGELDEPETLRLMAFALSLQHDRPKQQAVLKRLRAWPAAERETIAMSALTAAMSDGVATAAEVKFLEQLHNALGLPVEEVYRSIHRFSPEAATARPALGGDGEAAPASGMAAINHDRLARLRAETQEVSRMLSDIFVDEPANELESTARREASAAPSPYAGLDASHAALLECLASVEQPLPRDVFDGEARALGLLPDGAIEAINDWAFDHFEEALLDAEGEVNIVSHLRPRLLDMREPAP